MEQVQMEYWEIDIQEVNLGVYFLKQEVEKFASRFN